MRRGIRLLVVTILLVGGVSVLSGCKGDCPEGYDMVCRQTGVGTQQTCSCQPARRR
jgi:hypothetical protein